MEVNCVFAGYDISYGRALSALLRRFLIGGLGRHCGTKKMRRLVDDSLWEDTMCELDFALLTCRASAGSRSFAIVDDRESV